MKKIINIDELWSIINKVGSIGGNALILILIAKYLPSKDMALFFLFTAIFGVVGLVEGGFTQTISRHITYINNGKKSHVNLSNDLFISVNNRIFRVIVGIISVIALVGGTAYLAMNDSIKMSSADYLSWFIFILNTVIMLISNLYSSILIGFQKVAATQKYQLVHTSVNLIFIVVFILFLGQKNLFAIVLSNGIARIVLLFLNMKLAKSHYKSTKQNDIPIGYAKKIVFDDMKKMVLNIVSYKLLTSVFYIELASYISIELLASFGLTIQIFTYIAGISTIFISSNIPYFASLFSQNKYHKLDKTFLLKSSISVLLYLTGSIAFIFLFQWLQSLLSFKTGILNFDYIRSFIFFFTTEFIISILALYLIISNELNLMLFSLISTLFTLGISLLLFNLLFNLNAVFYARGIITILFIYIPAFFLLKRIVNNREIRVSI